MEQKEDGGDERAGVTDPDPPDEIRNREAPRDRDVDAPDADAFQEQPADREVHHHEQRERHGQPGEPAAVDRSRQDDVSDFFGDRRVVVAGRDDWFFELRVHACSSSGLGLRSFAR